jgi:hypothetical protein
VKTKSGNNTLITKAYRITAFIKQWKERKSFCRGKITGIKEVFIQSRKAAIHRRQLQVNTGDFCFRITIYSGSFCVETYVY